MTKQQPVKKVLLVGDCLSNGGAEKTLALLSTYFQNQGLEVHICVFMDWISYDYSGKLFNLGKINPNSSSIIRKFNRFIAFKKFIKNNNFDEVIDFRMRTNFVLEFLISKFIYPKNIVYTVHSGILDYYFPKNPFLSNLIYKNKNIIVVSEAIKEKIKLQKLANKVHCIYNPVEFNKIKDFENNDSFIIAVGSMNSEIKQFEILIQCYAKSILPKKGINLMILGEGKLNEKYTILANKLGVSDTIIFKGFVSNPFPYFKKALYTVLTSKNEGFPMVLIESLACETPVIAFNCFSGPSEIIINNENGILVENQNQEKMIEAMNEMFLNKSLYLHCKSNAKQSVQEFSLENIGNQWMQLFKTLK